jgi:archaemetzincin
VKREASRLYRAYRTAISAIFLLSYFLLGSCSPPPQRLPEGNIDVDSEIYIVPIDLLLFSTGSTFQTDLDDGSIPEILQQFRDNKIQLSDSISIEKKGNEWLVRDRDNKEKYSVRKENGKLNVFSPVEEDHLYALIPKLEKRFTTKAHLALDKRIPVPDNSYDYKAKQYAAMYIFTDLMKVDVPGDAKILGVTNVDLFVPESDLEFIFGQAQVGKNSKAAIISTLRMDPSSYVDGKPDDKLLIQRMVKEAVHELGHVFGLPNCGEPECVMYLPRNLRSLDKKTDNFCLKCQKAFRALKQSRSSESSSG